MLCSGPLVALKLSTEKKLLAPAHCAKALVPVKSLLNSQLWPKKAKGKFIRVKRKMTLPFSGNTIIVTRQILI
jgi:hypothetical protein